MHKRLAGVAWECVLDLSITIVYAIIVGILVVAIVASDHGAASIGRASLYAMLLPAAAFALVSAEVGVQVFKEWRGVRTGRF